MYWFCKNMIFDVNICSDIGTDDNRHTIQRLLYRSIAVIICYAPPNIWQNQIRGHVQMNLWSINENAAGKILTAVFTIFLLLHHKHSTLWLVDFSKMYPHTKVYQEDMTGPLRSWLYGSWIYNYLCNQCLSPLTFRIPLRRGVLDTTLCDKACQCRWFSPGTPVSFTNKTDCHNITEILLKVALNNPNHNQTIIRIWFLIGFCQMLG